MKRNYLREDDTQRPERRCRHPPEGQIKIHIVNQNQQHDVTAG